MYLYLSNEIIFSLACEENFQEWFRNLALVLRDLDCLLVHTA